MTSVGEDESTEVNSIGHLEEVYTGSHETTPMPEDHALEHVTKLTEEDFPHVPNSQRPISGPELSSADTAATEVKFQPIFPTDGSAPPEPIFMLTSVAPALVVEIIPSEFQLEVGESSSFTPAEITMNPSVVDSGSLAMVPHEEAPQSSPDQPSGDIFDFLDQWDASISSAEASTCLATSSTTIGALPNLGAEALLRSYRDRDLMSLEDKDERDKLKTAIETLANSGFFLDPCSAAMITYLFGRVEKFVPRRRSLLEEQSIGQDLEQRITSRNATMRKEIEIARRMQQETADIDEQVRQLQEKKTTIIAKVSEIFRSNKPLEAQLRQDAAAVEAYRENKLTLQSTLSIGDTAMKSFKTALRTLFPDA
ncbi:uncharacterized protein LOC110771610 [Prunus avium]|uniref:Uncharacterized protein LOC110771610 n=1 Tax=Prunus avium TaxID=42229 RepID=A0A6P5TX64_PRUAV|nr:uncharacterized protein LOC110771610 [Prunus avium]